MKSHMDLQSILLAAAGRNREFADFGFAVDGSEHTTDGGQSPQGDEPRLPDGYRPIRNAVRALLMTEPESEATEAARHSGARKANEGKTEAADCEQ